MEYLLARFLEVAELEAGSVSLEWSLVDIPTLARECVAVVQRCVPEPLHDRFTFHVQCRDEGGNPRPSTFLLSKWMSDACAKSWGICCKMPSATLRREGEST